MVVDVSQSVRQLWLSLAMTIVSAWRLCLDEGEAMKKRNRNFYVIFSLGGGADGWEYDVGWG